MFKYKILHFNRNVLIKAVRLSSAEQTWHKTKNAFIKITQTSVCVCVINTYTEAEEAAVFKVCTLRQLKLCFKTFKYF